MMTVANRPTIKNRRLTAKATKRSISMHVCRRHLKPQSAAGRRGAIDEQAASGDDLVAGLQVGANLHQIAIRQSRFDFAKLDRIVVVGDPEVHSLVFVN